MTDNSIQVVTKDTPPTSLNKEVTVAAKQPRSSNLELYRIICMLMIVAHHYVVNSGLTNENGLLNTDLTSNKSFFMILFGAWGKTGINCFLMITGYFMCKSKISLRKFVKLMAQIYFYQLLLYPILLVAGYEKFSIDHIVKVIMPIWGLSDNFIGCFIGFWLTIPFLNILVHNMNKRQHELLLLLMIGMYTILGSIPKFVIDFNYVTWFGIIYLVASYIRIYPNPLYERKQLWGWMTIICGIIAVLSIIVIRKLLGGNVIGVNYFFISDSNKIIAVAIAVCSFLWFKNLNIKYSKLINAFGAGTFGVLLIHANSNAMRTWLWKDTIDSIGHYSVMSTGELALYSIGVVLAIFFICNIIDQLRIATLEKWFFKWYDHILGSRLDRCIYRMIN